MRYKAPFGKSFDPAVRLEQTDKGRQRNDEERKSQSEHVRRQSGVEAVLPRRKRAIRCCFLTGPLLFIQVKKYKDLDEGPKNLVEIKQNREIQRDVGAYRQQAQGQ